MKKMNKCPNCESELDVIDWNLKIEGRYALFCKNCGYSFPFFISEIEKIDFKEGTNLWN